MRMQFLINDYVFLENVCNLNCSYCHIKKTPYQRLNYELMIDGKKLKIDNILKNTDNILKRQLRIIDSPILKVSGGEITIIPEIIDILKKYEKEYEVIQILTNNYSITPDFYDSLDRINNTQIQVSLDGHLFEMNKYRFSNKIQFDHALENTVILIKSYDMPLEINCVLTNANYNKIIDYVEWLYSFDRTDLILNIFPVIDMQKIFPPKDSFNVLTKLLNNYDNYPNLLLPHAYIEELQNFIKHKKRVSNCLVPYAVIGTYDTGKFDMCACSSDLPSLGNILEHGFSKLKNISNNKMLYKKVFQNPPYYKACDNCFTPYEVLSLYLEDSISCDEMKKIPLFRGKKTLERLKLIKSKVDFYQSETSLVTHIKKRLRHAK